MQNPLSIAIIGGSGKMGGWLAKHLAREGNSVIITGRNQQRLQEISRQTGATLSPVTEAINSAEIIILSVSIDSFEQVVKEIAPHLRPEQKVVDITSIKVEPVRIMHRYIKKALILGTHPMFGPGAGDIRGNTFVLTPVDDRERVFAGKVAQYLETRGARVVYATPQEHDEMMSLVLGLSHFIALVTADTMCNTGLLDRAGNFGGTTFNALLNIAGAVVWEDPEFYASLQMNLPYLPKFAGLFNARAREWSDMINTKDKEKFISSMSMLKQKLTSQGIDLQKTYRNMYKLSGKLAPGDNRKAEINPPERPGALHSS